MRFKIAIHSGSGAPPDAIERLARSLGYGQEETVFEPAGDAIFASWGEDAPVAMVRDEREEIGRRTVLDMVEAACDRSPELSFDWYAVSARRH
jgi:hypothetical protein